MGNRLFVGNLSFDATTESLRAMFSAVGDVDDVAIITDRETGQSRGFGFVTMSSSDGAQRAIAELNGASLEGRQIRVNEAE
ncbi:MAG TPA: RNA-binding protein, partial [Polyangiaceae bacterium]|nr:RNA-binding protein [Polyangiaceae bacterium]